MHITAKPQNHHLQIIQKKHETQFRFFIQQMPRKTYSIHHEILKNDKSPKQTEAPGSI